jgi:hypothetical protein
MKEHKPLIIVAICLAIITVPHFFITCVDVHVVTCMFSLVVALIVGMYLDSEW